MWRIVEFFRQRKAERQLKRFKLENPYRMLPADDGGESYRMECIFCREEGNIMSRFQHAPKCPAGKVEEAKYAAMRKNENK
jgi:hypothetical protein